jgi:hypothetical protein
MKPLATIFLSALALACAACASVDGGNGWSAQADSAAPSANFQPASLRAAEPPVADWQYNPYPPNDDDGNEMPPVVVGDP